MLSLYDFHTNTISNWAELAASHNLESFKIRNWERKNWILKIIQI